MIWRRYDDEALCRLTMLLERLAGSLRVCHLSACGGLLLAAAHVEIVLNCSMFLSRVHLRSTASCLPRLLLASSWGTKAHVHWASGPKRHPTSSTQQFMDHAACSTCCWPTFVTQAPIKQMLVTSFATDYEQSTSFKQTRVVIYTPKRPHSPTGREGRHACWRTERKRRPT